MFLYPLTGIVTLLTIFIAIGLGFRVGKARREHSIVAPSMDGPEAFNRVVRVQANTIETVVLFFPALWLFAVSFGDIYAAAVGVLYPLGRIIYANAYYKAADKRSLGFLIGFISHIILIIGGLIGMGHAALALYL